MGQAPLRRPRAGQLLDRHAGRHRPRPRFRLHRQHGAWRPAGQHRNPTPEKSLASPAARPSTARSDASSRRGFCRHAFGNVPTQALFAATLGHRTACAASGCDIAIGAWQAPALPPSTPPSSSAPL